MKPSVLVPEGDGQVGVGEGLVAVGLNGDPIRPPASMVPDAMVVDVPLAPSTARAVEMGDAPEGTVAPSAPVRPRSPIIGAA